MRIALVLDRFDPQGGGLERWTHGFAAFLIAAGHEVHVVAFGAANTALPLALHLVAPGRPSAAEARIARALAAIAPDVVHDSGTSALGDVFHPQTGSRLLSILRGLRSEGRGAQLRAALSPRMAGFVLEALRLEARQAARAKRIVAVSHRVCDLLARRHGVDAARFAVIPNGVDTGRFSPERHAGLRAMARARLGVGTATVFAVVAHNLRLKGVDTAMRALALLTGEGLDVRLIVAGGSPDARWTALARRLGVEARVSFLGPVAEIGAVYAAADVLAHPTRWDACSLVVLEAMACGLPVITTAMDGSGELITEGRDGFVLGDPEDDAALAARMRVLLDGERRRTIGAAARETALRHGIAANFAAVEVVLREVAGIRA